LEKITGYFILLCSVLFVCCSCFACGDKRSPSPVKMVPNPPGAPKIHAPLLVNPDFIIEELPRGAIKFKKERLRMDNRIRKRFEEMKGDTFEIPEQMVNQAPKENIKLPEQGKSIIWLSSYALYAMELDCSELWAKYSPYLDWSVESFSIAEAEYPKVLVGVSMAHLFTYNRILKVDMATGGLDGYFELPENLAGIYILHSLGDDRYFAVSYQGDDSWRMSLLNLGAKPAVEKAVILKDLGLPSSRGYNVFSEDGKVFYFNNRGLFISVDTESLEILKRQEMKNVPVKQIEFVPYRNELCAFSQKFLTLIDPKSFEVLQSFEVPMQPSIRDDVEGKSGIVLHKKGEPTYLTPSGVTYRPTTDELIITFDYSPNMLFINCGTKEQRFVKFAEESIADGQPVYFDEERLLIGGKYIYNFKTGSAKQIVGAENSSVLRSLIYF